MIRGGILENPITRLATLWPLQARLDNGETLFRFWQVVSYGWLHGSFQHWAVNMFGVFMFGKVIEAVWGSWRFLVYYLVCVIGAAITQLAVPFFGGIAAPTVGASGGLFGLLLAFGVMFPNQKILLLIPPIPLKAKYFVVGYGALELFLGISGTRTGIAHFAHLGGMVFGLFFIWIWKARNAARRAETNKDYR